MYEAVGGRRVMLQSGHECYIIKCRVFAQQQQQLGSLEHEDVMHG